MAILTFLASLLSWRRILTIIALMAVSVGIWFFGPLLSIVGRHLLVDETVRIAVIIGLFLGWASWEWLRIWRTRRANRRLIHALRKGRTLDRSSPSHDEATIIEERFTGALETLRETEMKGASHDVYQLPWYIVIGPPGSGKTTILRQSGLGFRKQNIWGSRISREAVRLAIVIGGFPNKGYSSTRQGDIVYKTTI